MNCSHTELPGLPVPWPGLLLKAAASSAASFPALGCSQPWHHPPARPVSREGWSWGLLFGAALLSGPSSCSTLGMGRERVADVCSVLLPSLAPGWGRGRGLSWATPAVALWGQGAGPEPPWPRRALRPACASPRPCGQAGPHEH